MNKLKALLTWGLLLAATHVMGYTITVDPIQIQAGQNTNLIINLTNTETDLTAYQMKLYLPTGVTVQKKSNGKYNYTINADRHDGVFSPSVKDAADGSILITCYSSDKDVITGTSGELIRLPLVVASTVTTSLQGSLKSIEFTDVQSTAHKHADVTFNLTMATQEAQTLSLTALPEMTYGDATYTLPATTTEGLTLTWTSSNTAVATIANGNLNIVAAGSATITATQAGNDSYLPFSREFTLTVNKATLTVTADDKTKQEGEQNPTLTVSYSGFVNGDNASVLTTQPTVSTTATTDSPAGTYPITVSGAAAANYNFTYVSGTLTVTERPVPTDPDTDISQLENTIYINRIEARAGETVTLSVKMKNSVVAEGFGFDLVLPEGISVALDEYGDPMAELSTERTNSSITNHFDADFKLDGSLNIQAYSTKGRTISGNDGEVAKITIKISESMTAGEYPIILANIAITDENSATVTVDRVKSTLEVPAYIIGDANNDGKVNVGDLTAISHYILERPDASFLFQAADANQDGNVNVGDLTAVSHIILWGSITRPQTAKSRISQELDPQ